MKKLLLVIASAGFLFTSCQKEDNETPSANLQNPTNRLSGPGFVMISPLPSTFIKKILIEEYVGTSYGQVPEANYDLQQILTSNPGRVYSVGMHYNDPLSTTQTYLMLNKLGNNNPSIPCGTVDRTMSNGTLFTDSKTFGNIVSTTLSASQNCGIALSSTVTRKIANIDIYCGFIAALPGTYKVTAYLIEDKVRNNISNLQQANAFNTTFGSPFFQMGNPIQYYAHNNVLSKVITNSSGDAISPSANKPGGQFIDHLKIDMPSKLDASSKFLIVAFITNTTTNEIVNVQQAPLGQIKDWN